MVRSQRLVAVFALVFLLIAPLGLSGPHVAHHAAAASTPQSRADALSPGGVWRAVAVFGGLLQEADSEHVAEEIVRTVGLPALAERWLLWTSESPDEEIVCLQEVSPAGVTVALGYYSMPGVPTRRISRVEIDDGSCRLRRDVAVPS